MLGPTHGSQALVAAREACPENNRRARCAVGPQHGCMLWNQACRTCCTSKCWGPSMTLPGSCLLVKHALEPSALEATAGHAAPLNNEAHSSLLGSWSCVESMLWHQSRDMLHCGTVRHICYSPPPPCPHAPASSECHAAAPHSPAGSTAAEPNTCSRCQRAHSKHVHCTQ